MGLSFDHFSDGDPLTAALLNAPFSDAKSWLDATDPSGWRNGMFGPDQAASVIRRPDPGDLWVNGNDSEHQYTEVIFGASLAYNAFGDDGGAATAPQIGNGDRTIVGHPSVGGGYTGVPAQIDFDGVKVGMINESPADNIAGFELLFNVDIIDAQVGDPGETGVEIMFCIQVLMSASSTWFTIDSTERFYSVDNRRISTAADDLNIPGCIRAWFGPDEVVAIGRSPENEDVIGFRVMTSKYSTGGVGDVTYTLRGFNFTAIPWRTTDI